jgi:hypothetical protein
MESKKAFAKRELLEEALNTFIFYGAKSIQSDETAQSSKTRENGQSIRLSQMSQCHIYELSTSAL